MPRRIPAGPREGTTARDTFARRLRELRVPRGYRTARSLARALGIDENRYTRYERAEVEPDLALIMRICGLLSITPNDLLSEQEPSRSRRSGRAPRRSGPTSEASAPFPPGLAEAPHRDLTISTAAWELAEAAAAALRRPGAAPIEVRADGPGSPLATVTEVGAIYRTIMQQPFEAITELADDPAVAALDADKAAALHERIQTLVFRLKGVSPPDSSG